MSAQLFSVLRLLRWTPALLLCLLLGACTPVATLSYSAAAPLSPVQLAQLPSRPPGSPDVLIFGISGRCGPPCQAPEDSWDYLGERGTLEKLARVFRARGLNVLVSSYAERVTGDFTSRRSKLPQRGILDLLGEYQRFTEQWVTGRRDPARVILVGHSHGAVWAHYLTVLFPAVPVAALIDLDANCAAWNADHGAETVSVKNPLWQSGAGLSPLQACSSIRVAGRNVRLKDVVWPNVAQNFEVQSKRWPASPSQSPGLYVNYLFELTPNERLDGSRAGIQTFVSVREDHSAVSYPNSQAIAWVSKELQTLPWLPPLPAGAGPRGG